VVTVALILTLVNNVTMAMTTTTTTAFVVGTHSVAMVYSMFVQKNVTDETLDPGRAAPTDQE
jgi:hypothetical protein